YRGQGKLYPVTSDGKDPADPKDDAGRRGQIPARRGHRREGAPSARGRIKSFRGVQELTGVVVSSQGVDRAVGADGPGQAHACRRHRRTRGPGVGAWIVDLHRREDDRGEAKVVDTPDSVDPAVGADGPGQETAVRLHIGKPRPAIGGRVI